MPAIATLKSLETSLNRLSKTSLWTVAIALVLAVGLFDYLIGYEISAVLFYSLPIILMVWFGDKISAVFIALCCALVWWWADEASGHYYSREWYHIWETVARLAYFLVFVGTGGAIKSRLELLERSQRLEREIIRISEREQQRLGRDLHDGVCQYFAAIGCAAGSLKRNLEKQGVAQAARAGEIEELILKGVAQTHRLARGLLPVENDPAGLQSALQELAARSTQLLNLQCTFECDIPASILDNLCATQLYHIAQESISNASRHGKARNIAIRLSASPREVEFSVTDDGIGLPMELPRGTGMGLGIMQYRSRIIGAQFEVGPCPGGGTIVRCSIIQP